MEAAYIKTIKIFKFPISRGRGRVEELFLDFCDMFKEEKQLERAYITHLCS